MSISLPPIKAANKLILDNTGQITFQLTLLQDQKSLTLHGRSFEECDCYSVDVSFAYTGYDTLVIDNRK
jgi:hypothetical protein